MVKRHLKRIATPSSWPIKRKGTTWVIRPNPGSHNLSQGMAIGTVIKELLKFAKTTKETKNILNTKNVLINGKQTKDVRAMVGVFDVIQFPDLKKNFRISLTENKKLKIVKIEDKEANLVPSKVINKTKLKGNKLQLNMSPGKNITVDKDTYKTQDTLILEMPKQTIKEQLPFEEKSCVFLLGGKQVGKVGLITKIQEKIIEMQIGDTTCKTLRKHAIVIGKDKPKITV